VNVSATGSVAYKLALVAAGAGDATFTLLPKNEWDIASGAALIAEAGGLMTDNTGRPIKFNSAKTRLPGMIASNGKLQAAIEKLIGAR
jgi:myo-inositol-1(or 4)-monophosphatase